MAKTWGLSFRVDTRSLTSLAKAATELSNVAAKLAALDGQVNTSIDKITGLLEKKLGAIREASQAAQEAAKSVPALGGAGYNKPLPPRQSSRPTNLPADPSTIFQPVAKASPDVANARMVQFLARAFQQEFQHFAFNNQDYSNRFFDNIRKEIGDHITDTLETLLKSRINQYKDPGQKFLLAEGTRAYLNGPKFKEDFKREVEAAGAKGKEPNLERFVDRFVRAIQQKLVGPVAFASLSAARTNSLSDPRADTVVRQILRAIETRGFSSKTRETRAIIPTYVENGSVSARASGGGADFSAFNSKTLAEAGQSFAAIIVEQKVTTQQLATLITGLKDLNEQLKDAAHDPNDPVSKKAFDKLPDYKEFENLLKGVLKTQTASRDIAGEFAGRKYDPKQIDKLIKFLESFDLAVRHGYDKDEEQKVRSLAPLPEHRTQWVREAREIASNSTDGRSNPAAAEYLLAKLLHEGLVQNQIKPGQPSGEKDSGLSYIKKNINELLLLLDHAGVQYGSKEDTLKRLEDNNIPNRYVTAMLENSSQTFEKAAQLMLEAAEHLSRSNGLADVWNRSTYRSGRRGLADDGVGSPEQITPTIRNFRFAFGRLAPFAAAGATTYGAFNLAQSSLQTATDYEKNLIGIRRTANPLVGDFGKITEAAKKMSSEFGVGLPEVTAAMGAFARQGKSTAEILEQTRAVLLAVNTTDLDVAESIDAITATQRVFRTSTSQSIQVIDSLVAVQNQTGVSAKTMGDAVKTAGTIARASGVDFHTLIGMVAAVGEATRESGEGVGQAVKEIFEHFRDDSAVKSLQQVGIYAQDANGNLRSVSEVIAELSGKWNTLTDAQRTNVAVSVGGVRHLNDFYTLIERADRALDLSVTSLASQGAAVRSNDQQMQSLAKRIDVLRSSWHGLVTTFAETGAFDALKRVADLATLGLQGIEKLNKISGGQVGNLAGSALAGAGVIGAGHFFLGDVLYGGFRNGFDIPADRVGAAAAKNRSISNRPGDIRSRAVQDAVIDGTAPIDPAAVTLRNFLFSRRGAGLGLIASGFAVGGAYEQFKDKTPGRGTTLADIGAESLASGLSAAGSIVALGKFKELGAGGKFAAATIAISALASIYSKIQEYRSSGSASGGEKLDLDKISAAESRIASTRDAIREYQRDTKAKGGVDADPTRLQDILQRASAVNPALVTRGPNGVLSGDLNEIVRGLDAAYADVRGRKQTVIATTLQETLKSPQFVKLVNERKSLSKTIEDQSKSSSQRFEAYGKLSEVREQIAGSTLGRLQGAALNRGLANKGVTGGFDDATLNAIADANGLSVEDVRLLELTRGVQGATRRNVDVRGILNRDKRTAGDVQYVQYDRDGGIFDARTGQKATNPGNGYVLRAYDPNFQRGTYIADDNNLHSLAQNLERVLGKLLEGNTSRFRVAESLNQGEEFATFGLGPVTRVDQAARSRRAVLEALGGNSSILSTRNVLPQEQIAEQFRLDIGDIQSAASRSATVAPAGLIRAQVGFARDTRQFREYANQALENLIANKGQTDILASGSGLTPDGFAQTTGFFKRLQDINPDVASRSVFYAREIDRLKGQGRNEDAEKVRQQAQGVLNEGIQDISYRNVQQLTGGVSDLSTRIQQAISATVTSLGEQSYVRRRLGISSDPTTTPGYASGLNDLKRFTQPLEEALKAAQEGIVELSKTAKDNDPALMALKDSAAEVEATLRTLKTTTGDFNSAIKLSKEGIAEMEKTLALISSGGANAGSFGLTGQNAIAFTKALIEKETKVQNGIASSPDAPAAERAKAQRTLENLARLQEQADLESAKLNQSRTAASQGLFESVAGRRVFAGLGYNPGPGSDNFVASVRDSINELVQKSISGAGSLPAGKQEEFLAQLNKVFVPLAGKLSALNLASDPGFLKSYTLASPSEQAAADYALQLQKQGASINDIFANPAMREAAQGSPLLQQVLERLAPGEQDRQATNFLREISENTSFLPDLARRINDARSSAGLPDVNIDPQITPKAPGYRIGTMNAGNTKDVGPDGRILRDETPAMLHKGEIVLNAHQSEALLRNRFASGTKPDLTTEQVFSRPGTPDFYTYGARANHLKQEYWDTWDLLPKHVRRILNKNVNQISLHSVPYFQDGPGSKSRFSGIYSSGLLPDNSFSQRVAVATDLRSYRNRQNVFLHELGHAYDSNVLDLGFPYEGITEALSPTIAKEARRNRYLKVGPAYIANPESRIYSAKPQEVVADAFAVHFGGFAANSKNQLIGALRYGNPSNSTRLAYINQLLKPFEEKYPETMEGLAKFLGPRTQVLADTFTNTEPNLGEAPLSILDRARELYNKVITGNNPRFSLADNQPAAKNIVESALQKLGLSAKDDSLYRQLARAVNGKFTTVKAGALKRPRAAAEAFPGFVGAKGITKGEVFIYGGYGSSLTEQIDDTVGRLLHESVHIGTLQKYTLRSGNATTAFDILGEDVQRRLWTLFLNGETAGHNIGVAGTLRNGYSPLWATLSAGGNNALVSEKGQELLSELMAHSVQGAYKVGGPLGGKARQALEAIVRFNNDVRREVGNKGSLHKAFRLHIESLKENVGKAVSGVTPFSVTNVDEIRKEIALSALGSVPQPTETEEWLHQLGLLDSTATKPVVPNTPSALKLAAQNARRRLGPPLETAFSKQFSVGDILASGARGTGRLANKLVAGIGSAGSSSISALRESGIFEALKGLGVGGRQLSQPLVDVISSIRRSGLRGPLSLLGQGLDLSLNAPGAAFRNTYGFGRSLLRGDYEILKTITGTASDLTGAGLRGAGRVGSGALNLLARGIDASFNTTGSVLRSGAAGLGDIVQSLVSDGRSAASAGVSGATSALDFLKSAPGDALNYLGLLREDVEKIRDQGLGRLLSQRQNLIQYRGTGRRRLSTGIGESAINAYETFGNVRNNVFGAIQSGRDVIGDGLFELKGLGIRGLKTGRNFLRGDYNIRQSIFNAASDITGAGLRGAGRLGSGSLNLLARGLDTGFNSTGDFLRSSYAGLSNLRQLGAEGLANGANALRNLPFELKGLGIQGLKTGRNLLRGDYQIANRITQSYAGLDRAVGAGAEFLGNVGTNFSAAFAAKNPLLARTLRVGRGPATLTLALFGDQLFDEKEGFLGGANGFWKDALKPAVDLDVSLATFSQLRGLAKLQATGKILGSSPGKWLLENTAGARNFAGKVAGPATLALLPWEVADAFKIGSYGAKLTGLIDAKTNKANQASLDAFKGALGTNLTFGLFAETDRVGENALDRGLASSGSLVANPGFVSRFSQDIVKDLGKAERAMSAAQQKALGVARDRTPLAVLALGSDRIAELTKGIPDKGVLSTAKKSIDDQIAQLNAIAQQYGARGGFGSEARLAEMKERILALQDRRAYIENLETENAKEGFKGVADVSFTAQALAVGNKVRRGESRGGRLPQQKDLSVEKFDALMLSVPANVAAEILSSGARSAAKSIYGASDKAADAWAKYAATLPPTTKIGDLFGKLTAQQINDPDYVARLMEEGKTEAARRQLLNNSDTLYRPFKEAQSILDGPRRLEALKATGKQFIGSILDRINAGKEQAKKDFENRDKAAADTLPALNDQAARAKQNYEDSLLRPRLVEGLQKQNGKVYRVYRESLVGTDRTPFADRSTPETAQQLRSRFGQDVRAFNERQRLNTVTLGKLNRLSGESKGKEDFLNRVQQTNPVLFQAVTDYTDRKNKIAELEARKKSGSWSNVLEAELVRARTGLYQQLKDGKFNEDTLKKVSELADRTENAAKKAAAAREARRPRQETDADYNRRHGTSGEGWVRAFATGSMDFAGANGVSSDGRFSRGETIRVHKDEMVLNALESQQYLRAIGRLPDPYDGMSVDARQFGDSTGQRFDQNRMTHEGTVMVAGDPRFSGLLERVAGLLEQHHGGKGPMYRAGDVIPDNF